MMQKVGGCGGLRKQRFGNGFTSWHARTSEKGVVVDMNVVCPQDAHNALQSQGNEVAGKKEVGAVIV